MTDRALRLAAALVAAAGAVVAGYLTYVHYRPDALVCTGGGGCEAVQESRYAELVGVPVALLGLLAYAAVLALVVWDAPVARTLAVAIALSAAGFAFWNSTRPSGSHSSGDTGRRIWMIGSMLRRNNVERPSRKPSGAP